MSSNPIKTPKINVDVLEAISEEIRARIDAGSVWADFAKTAPEFLKRIVPILSGAALKEDGSVDLEKTSLVVAFAGMTEGRPFDGAGTSDNNESGVFVSGSMSDFWTTQCAKGHVVDLIVLDATPAKQADQVQPLLEPMADTLLTFYHNNVYKRDHRHEQEAPSRKQRRTKAAPVPT